MRGAFASTIRDSRNAAAERPHSLALFNAVVEGATPDMDLLLDAPDASQRPEETKVLTEGDLMDAVDAATIRVEDARSKIADKYAESLGGSICPVQ